MISWLKSIISPPGSVRNGTATSNSRRIAARYDAAQTTINNQNHWANADALSPDAAVKVAVRKKLRERARYEVSNNCYAKGMVNTLASDTIGTGPHLQLLTDDEDFNSMVEEMFQDWAQEISLREKLLTGRKARVESGEVFFVFITNPKINGPIKLDIKLVESDQVTAEDGIGMSLTEDNADGIKYDESGNPVSYRILKNHPGNDTNSIALKKIAPTPADQVVHMFRQERPGQPRGVPEISPALPLFAILRRYTLACLEAAEIAANNAYVIQTEHSSLTDIDSEVAPFEVVDMERNMATVMPAGWKAVQMKPEQPTDTYPDFKREIVNEVSRVLGIPYNIAAGDSSSYNYASGRLDHQAYFKDLDIERAYQQDTILLKAFEKWMAEALRTQIFRSVSIPSSDDINRLHLQKTWYWDGQGAIDPVREAKAQEIRLKMNLTSLAIECAKEGNDWREVVEQRGREQSLAEDVGIEQPLSMKNLESDNYGGSDEVYFGSEE